MEMTIKCAGQKDKKVRVKTPPKKAQIQALKDPSVFSFTKTFMQTIIDSAPKKIVEKMKRNHAKMRTSKNKVNRELGEMIHSMGLKFKE